MTQPEFDFAYVRVPEQGTMIYELLSALKNGERLTPLSALEKYRCFSLSQRMGGLKKSGWPIRSKMIELPSGKRVACYWMEK